MPPKRAAKECVDYYVHKYGEYYGEGPVFNRNNAVWGFDDILKDFDAASIKEYIDTWFDEYSDHQVTWFFSNYHKIAGSKVERDADAAARRAVMEESRLRTEEWRKRVQSRTSNN